ncbi:hypothetical protein [Geodermatophilus sp. URMC 64]
MPALAGRIMLIRLEIAAALAVGFQHFELYAMRIQALIRRKDESHGGAADRERRLCRGTPLNDVPRSQWTG